MDGEKRHDVVLRLSQVNLLFANKDLPRIIVDQQILKVEFSAGGAFCLFTVPMTAENGADTGQQFLRAKGLGDIIIRPQIPGLPPYPLVGTGGSFTMMGTVSDSQTFSESSSNHPVRQTKIQNDEIG